MTDPALHTAPNAAPPRSFFVWLVLGGGYCAFFGLLATLQPYLTTLFLEHRIDHDEAGMAVALLYTLAGASPLAVIALARQRGYSARRCAQFCMGATFACALMLVWQGQALMAHRYVALLALLTACYAPFNALLDVCAMQASLTHRLHFGRMRLMGSLGYIATATAMGYILPDKAVGHTVHVAIAALCAVVWITTWYFVDASLAAPSPSEHAAPRTDASSRTPRAQALLLSACALHYASFSPFMFGFTLYGQSLGLQASSIGWAWSLGVASEVGFFTVATALVARWGPIVCLSVAFLAAPLRWTLLALFPNPAVFFVSQTLHGPAFALFYASALVALSQVPQPQQARRNQTVYSALVAGLASGPGMLLAGWAAGHWSLMAMFYLVLPLNALAILLLAFSARKRPTINSVSLACE